VGTVPRAVFPARHAGPRFGGMGTLVMTFDAVSVESKKNRKSKRELSPEQAAAAAMVAEARERGLDLTGQDGLFKLFTKNVLETALNKEITDHLGHDKNRAEPDRDSTNVRNGARAKRVPSNAPGEVEIEVPRDLDSSFEPKIVKKRQRRIGEVDKIVLSLYAKGMTTGEISAHFADIYGASVSKETVSRITDKVVPTCKNGLTGRCRAPAKSWRLKRGFRVGAVAG
jgi:putative transposase